MNIAKYFGYHCDMDEFVPVEERNESADEEIIPFFDHAAFKKDHGMDWEEFFFADRYAPTR